MNRVLHILVHATGVLLGAQSVIAWSQSEHSTQVYFGDTHVHSSYSYDSYTMQNRSADPDVAYRFAKGMPAVHPGFGGRIQLERPLDFLVVADHAEYLGITAALFSGDERVANTPTGRRLLEMGGGPGQERLVLVEMARSMHRNEPFEEINLEPIIRSTWERSIEIADRHYAPGVFTSLIGWEWSGFPTANSIHRVVLMREGADIARQFLPFSTFHSERPEDLWQWLEQTGERIGATFLAIPHNSNISSGRMFQDVDSDGRPISGEYARTRIRWEPIMEITQTKGDSETHPLLSPDDEFADFGTYERARLPGVNIPPPNAAEYARAALRRGLEIEARVGANPYKFGFIGSTDIHTGLSTTDEAAYTGKLGVEGTPLTKTAPLQGGNEPGTYKIGRDFEAAGLAGVWAEQNTREALFDAFRRKEVYATSGPRIHLRFFGGWDYAPEDAEANDLADVGYRGGVPMGGELARAPDGRAIAFLVHAAMDPLGANLDRIQIVKGWLDDDGAAHERVYNVALSDGRSLDASGQAPPVGTTVDLETATYTNSIGATQLSAVWEDPDFDPDAPAFYYARAIEIPTPRHTLFDAVALGEPPFEAYKATIQERAYSSPIWYSP
ncbi:MAG: DUF3604 domain-containing protein [Proteobacteria bacterium]|nr:DUF3604 domain-containing protein [Pseudomonadota bacterium]